MKRALLLFAYLGVIVTAVGCCGGPRCTRHGVCDCDAPPAVYGGYDHHHAAHPGGQHYGPAAAAPVHEAGK